jgi:predicted RNase H-like HicB family nuclease
MTKFSMATLRLVPMPERHLHFRIRQEDGSLWATVDEYPGVFATGDDLEELRASLEEGIRFMKAEAGEPLPDVRLLPLSLPDETSASAELVSAS